MKGSTSSLTIASSCGPDVRTALWAIRQEMPGSLSARSAALPAPEKADKSSAIASLKAARRRYMIDALSFNFSPRMA